MVLSNTKLLCFEITFSDVIKSIFNILQLFSKYNIAIIQGIAEWIGCFTLVALLYACVLTSLCSSFVFSQLQNLGTQGSRARSRPAPIISWRLIMNYFLRSFSSLPLNHSRRVVVSCKRKYVLEVLVNGLFKLAQEKVVN